MGISSAAAEGLSAMMWAFEATAWWPAGEQEVLTALIPKADGGLRPIALFRTIYRVYAKIRAKQVRGWASTHQGYQFNNSKGRWVGDSTWRNQVRAILGNSGRIDTEILLDVKKAFENVNRKQLVEMALLTGIPLGHCT